MLQPLVMGRAVSLHPLAVVLGLTQAGVLAGIIGALLAVPAIAFLNTFVRVLAAEDPARAPRSSTARTDLWSTRDRTNLSPPPPDGDLLGLRSARVEPLEHPVHQTGSDTGFRTCRTDLLPRAARI